jgi:peptide/nickel transport system permease protein
MILFILKRLFYIACILIVMSILVFGITQILPGNVAHMILGQFASEESILIIQNKLGLNDPIYVQYWRWFSNILSGDLGVSLIMERPVGPWLFDSLQKSAILAIISITLVAIIGIALGVIAAVHQNRTTDHMVSLFTYFGISLPEFFWGIVFILVFSRYLGWLPSSGYVPMSDGFLKWLSHLIAPTATLTFTLIAHISRLTRSSMLEVLQSRYVTAARAKGIPERVVVVRHALKNALLPTITVLAIDVGWLFGGIVVVETVFAYPGLGRLLTFAIERHDLPIIQAAILIITALYAISNLVADLLYAYFNPKVRYTIQKV